MKAYSIKDLEQLSGIKAHTLRIWEQRYGLLQPSRSSTNIRSYNDEQLKLVLNISLLKEHGFKISEIAKMDNEQIQSEVIGVTSRSEKHLDKIQFLTMAMLELDESRFELVMNNCILNYGMENTMTQVIYPFLRKIGLLWQTGAINPAQEHFITYLIRQKLIVAIDGQMHRIKSYAPKYVLYLQENEMHELALLYTNYLLKANGCKVIYLGQNVPTEDLNSVYEMHQPEYLLTILTNPIKRESLQAYALRLSEQFENSTILLSGPSIAKHRVDLPHNVQFLHSIEQLKTEIQKSLPLV